MIKTSEKIISKKIGSAVVLGGGIGGMQAALDLAESGIKVYLVDSSPAIGGRMVQLDKTFPTNECAMCVVSPKLVDCARHLNIEIITNADLEKIQGEAGHFTVTLNKRARYVHEDKCTGCGLCVLNCPVNNTIQLVADGERQKVQLPSEDQSVMRGIIDKHKNTKGALMLILQAVNAHYRYFREDILKYISVNIQVPLSSIVRIATFYNAFSLKPRGRHTISICIGTACFVSGSDRILNHLSDTLNVQADETTKDLRFTLKGVRCLGCCSIAPAMMINDKVYGHVKIRELTSILKDYT